MSSFKFTRQLLCSPSQRAALSQAIPGMDVTSIRELPEEILHPF
jgi:hypothetical protein